uniref:Uncharacterized protein n=1 Tax=viral metagenome TaxID=1070528 RepID=A0A6C0C983_9ZZZZ
MRSLRIYYAVRRNRTVAIENLFIHNGRQFNIVDGSDCDNNVYLGYCDSHIGKPYYIAKTAIRVWKKTMDNADKEILTSLIILPGSLVHLPFVQDYKCHEEIKNNRADQVYVEANMTIRPSIYNHGIGRRWIISHSLICYYFLYVVGKIVKVDIFYNKIGEDSNDMQNTCTNGIHYFHHKEDAAKYVLKNI